MALAKGAVWTFGAYSAVQALRFFLNVILARLLAPELFGLMVVVNTIRNGAELMSDIGVTQCVVKAGKGEAPEFYNTAWTIQAIRGGVLFLICVALAPVVSSLYGAPELSALIAVSASCFLIAGFASLAPAILQSTMQLARLNMFELQSVIGFVVFQIAISYLYPTVWSLVFGLIFGTTLRTVGTFFLVPGLTCKFELSIPLARRIFKFGKWVGAASLIYFLSSSFDRLYLAGVVPLATLGVYAIARTISDVVSASVASLGNYVVFPFVASNADGARPALRSKMKSPRMALLLAFALGIAVLAGVADLLIASIFDARYHAAGSMTTILFLGGWFAILSSLNDSTLLGVGAPEYGAMANAAKLAAMVIGLPLGVAEFGIMGAVFAAAAAEICRYALVLFGQTREQISFAVQDAMGTIALGATFGAVMWLRGLIGIAPPAWLQP